MREAAQALFGLVASERIGRHRRDARVQAAQKANHKRKTRLCDNKRGRDIIAARVVAIMARHLRAQVHCERACLAIDLRECEDPRFVAATVQPDGVAIVRSLRCMCARDVDDRPGRVREAPSRTDLQRRCEWRSLGSLYRCIRRPGR